MDLHKVAEESVPSTQMQRIQSPGNLCKTTCEITNLDFKWTIHNATFFENLGKQNGCCSSEFLAETTPEAEWSLSFCDKGPDVTIYLYRSSPYIRIVDCPIKIKIAINENGEKMFQQDHHLPTNTQLPCTVFQIPKKVLSSECLTTGKLTFNCQIEKMDADSLEQDLPQEPFTSSDQLFTVQFEELFNSMKFADVTLNVNGCIFQAHKTILAVRSPVFAAMFVHQPIEKVSSQIEIQDIEPDVFHEVLRFIYTGRVPIAVMEKMAARLLAAADKYLLDQLIKECGNQLIHRMSADNCLELLLLTDQYHPAADFKKNALDFLRRLPHEVMATDGWKRAKEDHPEQCCNILEMLVNPHA